MDPNIQQLLNNTQNIIVVTPPRIDLDQIYAACSLSLALAEAQKNVKILFPQKLLNTILLSKLSPNLKNLLADTKSKIFKISFNGDDLNIVDVNLRQEEGKYNIYVASENEIVGMPKISIKKAEFPNDLVIAIGINKPENLSNLRLFKDNKPDLEKIIDINIGKVANGFKHYFSLAKVNSLSVIVFKLLQQLALPINKEIATYLLAGLYWKTDSFKYHIREDFETAGLLIKQGAVQKKALVLGLNNLDYKQMRYYQEIYNNLHLAIEGIYYSTVAKEVKKLGQHFFRDLIPFSEIYDAKVAFVILEDDNFNTVYIKSNISDFNLNEFVKPFNGKGNHSQAYFISSLPVNEIVSILTTDLNRLLNLRQRKVSDNLTNPGKQNIESGDEFPAITTPVEEQNQVVKRVQPENQTNNSNKAVLSDPLAPASSPPEPLQL